MKPDRLKTIVKAGAVMVAIMAALAVIVGAGGVPPEPAAAAEPRQLAVMHIFGPDIPGPYTHQALGPGGIKVLDMRLSVTASPNSGDPNDPWAIDPAFSQMTVTKEVDKASPLLYLNCATGQHFNAVFLRMLGTSVEPETAEPYYEIVLEDVVISQVSNRMVYRETGSYAHLEDVSLRYGLIRWTHLPAGVSAAWDIVTNAPQ